MAKSHNKNYINPEQQQQQDYSEMENFTDDDFNSEEDPSYTNELDKAQSNFSILSIKNKSLSRDYEESEVNDVGMSSHKLNKEEMKSFEQIQKLIECGQVEKLKVDQCKVYLRKHGLRLTGKKDILIQRIKEHTEILNGGGEKKYPPSSFVLNCKGDACLGDVVMFEQTVYEGYSIVSRSASGPPCGKRTIAGRIVNESYGAAKQQHTFTVEVLWSKGDKPLSPLHPLLIKGRNLYKLDTRRQKWADEAERRRVLDEKHSRGTVARSNREARVQEKMTKKSLKGIRDTSKNKENQCHQKNSKHATDQFFLCDPKKLLVGSNSQQQVQSKASIDWKENLNPAISRYPSSQPIKPDMLASRFHQVPRSQSYYPTHGYQRHVEYKDGPRLPVLLRPPSYQQQIPTIHHNQRPRSYSYEQENLMPLSYHFNERSPQRTVTNAKFKHSTGLLQRPSQRQQLCRYYPQGRCHYGNQCKFLHESK